VITIAPAPAELDEARQARWRAVADLYHAYFTGLILAVVTRRGAADAAEFVFRIFRRQQQERFLPGLDKLGLSGLPHAVAAAQYHYLSNWIGGVSVEYMYESDRKAWIRYPPPRWIWRGTAICAIPSEVSAAMLRGWHANNGVVLGNPRLGFVCTKMTVDGDDGLEGYYREHDTPLSEDERLVFDRSAEAPAFDPGRAPQLPIATWPQERLAKAYRNYAMEYVRTAAPVAVGLFGDADGGQLLRVTGRLVGMQLFDDIATPFGVTRGSVADFMSFLSGLLAAAGEDVQMDAAAGEIRQAGWKLMAGLSDATPACGEALRGLVEGLAAAFGRHVAVELAAEELAADARRVSLRWRIAARRLKS
jgi:hypothetical protein